MRRTTGQLLVGQRMEHHDRGRLRVARWGQDNPTDRRQHLPTACGPPKRPNPKWGRWRLPPASWSQRTCAKTNAAQTWPQKGYSWLSALTKKRAVQKKENFRRWRSLAERWGGLPAAKMRPIGEGGFRLAGFLAILRMLTLVGLLGPAGMIVTETILELVPGEAAEVCNQRHFPPRSPLPARGVGDRLDPRPNLHTAAATHGRAQAFLSPRVSQIRSAAVAKTWASVKLDWLRPACISTCSKPWTDP